MAKRSRDASFSPDGDEAASDTTRLSSDQEDPRTTKFIAYDAPTMSTEKSMMQCSLPPHTESLGFASVQDFEIHYVKEHTNRCVECGKNFPSAHFLNLHLDENHNPVREALAAKGEKTYACFVLECEKKCSTPQKRRMHLVDKHNFPKVYNFQVVNKGIDNTNSLLQEGRKRRLSLVNDPSLLHRQRATSITKPTTWNRSEHNAGLLTTTENGCTNTRALLEDEQGVTSISPESGPISETNDLNGLENSLAALHFTPRIVQEKRSKGQA